MSYMRHVYELRFKKIRNYDAQYTCMIKIELTKA